MSLKGVPLSSINDQPAVKILGARFKVKTNFLKGFCFASPTCAWEEFVNASTTASIKSIFFILILISDKCKTFCCCILMFELKKTLVCKAILMGLGINLSRCLSYCIPANNLVLKVKSSVKRSFFGTKVVLITTALAI
jgi:hypothetical protein